MRHFIVLFLLFFLSKASSSKESRLLAFKTDLCTFFPEGTIDRPMLWADCCISHDLVYWIGGTSSQQDQADLELRNCVSSKANSFYADLMYRGVRLGHLSPIKSQYRWSWGWNEQARHYQGLSNREKSLAKQELIKSETKRLLIDKFTKLYLE